MSYYGGVDEQWPANEFYRTRDPRRRARFEHVWGGPRLDVPYLVPYTLYSGQFDKLCTGCPGMQAMLQGANEKLKSDQYSEERVRKFAMRIEEEVQAAFSLLDNRTYYRKVRRCGEATLSFKLSEYTGVPLDKLRVEQTRIKGLAAEIGEFQEHLKEIERLERQAAEMRLGTEAFAELERYVLEHDCPDLT